MIHLENMIPYEIPTILQTQAKVYSNMNGSLANNYVTLVKRKLLVLGIDSSLRNYPTNIFMKDNGTNNNNSLNSINNPTDINNNINNNNNTIKIDSSHYSQLTNNSDINNNNLNSGIHISDLEKLLKAYNETNMVPKELWEDSIFRPKWFKLTFVPALMNWKLTDKKMIENRYQLIEALNAKRKIPTSLYQQFINKK
ncbi:hypothetical protein BJ944DRAFT_263721 [Cunninghamella echinulata]|nr:hypothetical protein BJ944DRAFT_263721 [Cunninghamella echinulata]